MYDEVTVVAGPDIVEDKPDTLRSLAEKLRIHEEKTAPGNLRSDWRLSNWETLSRR